MGLPGNTVGNRAISGDVMMLGLEPLEDSFANPVAAAVGARSTRSVTKPPTQQKKPAAKKGDDDLLSLLEFTVSSST
jgi:hypothetical protein